MPRFVLPLALCLVTLLSLPRHAPAQEAAEPPTPAALESARRGADSSDEATRNEVAAAVDAAAQAVARHAVAAEQLREVREQARQAARESGALERRLAQDPLASFRSWRGRLPAKAEGEELELLLERERGDMLRIRGSLSETSEGLAQARAVSADAAPAEAERRLLAEDLRARLAVPPAVIGPSANALNLRWRAELAALDAESHAAAASKGTAAERARYLELKQRSLQRELGEHEQRIEVLQALIARRSDRDLTDLLEDLQTTAESFAESDSPLAIVATENRQIGEQLVWANTSLAQRRRDLQRRLGDRDAVAAALRNTRARLALDSHSEALGLVLLSERRRLGNSALQTRELDSLQSELGAARLQQLGLAEARDGESNPAAAVERRLLDADESDSAQRAVTRENLHRLLGTRSELLPRLETSLQRLIDALEQSEAAVQQTAADTAALAALLDRQLFWIPSHAPVGFDWLARQPAGWFDLLKPDRWQRTTQLLFEHSLDTPFRTTLSVVVLGILFAWRKHLRLRLEALAPPWRRVREDRYRLTVKTLWLTVVIALPWALLTWALGDLCRRAGETGKFTDSLGTSLMALAGSVLLLDFLRWMNIDRGLAHAHFRWTRARRGSLRQALPWLAAVLLPIQLFASLAFNRGVELAIDSAARLMLVMFALFCAAMVWRLLAVGKLWTPRGLAADHPSSWRAVLRLATPGLLLAIAGLLLSGYVFSGAVIMSCLWQTLGIVLAVTVINGVLARWLLLGERRLALKRHEIHRIELGGETRGRSEALTDAGGEELSVEKINTQSGQLLRALTISLWVAGLLYVWSDVLPALARLDEFALWTFSTVGDDGQPALATVSLRALLLGLLVLAVTFIAARNLPGLMEIGLLSRISLDAPTRYAFASVSRYLIVIVGSISGLALFGVRWSQLQWLAAALSVGLGFGLQEIFGNFVSGLILLFERPFRVGDVITIGDLSGTVSRIRTRATTLVDFDNKEIVVPNKTFIIDRLINWTLSDSRTRLILRFGVGYGSDIERVRQLLLEAAAAHPLVVKDPEPCAWLLEFGASTLNFELRVFVDSVIDRVLVTSELNTRIASVFAAEGIVFAYPQLDVHLRGMPPDTSLPRTTQVKPHDRHPGESRDPA